MFIFIGHGAGGQDEAQYCFDGAKKFCEKQGLLLVTPISDDTKGFINEKNELVIKLVKSFICDNKVSPKNILIGGISNGGVAALQIASSGELPFCGALAIPGIFYAPLKRTTGFKGLHVYLRIGANDELKWSAEFDKTNQALIGYGAKVDGKLVEKGGYLFVINWEEVGKWKESIIEK